MQSNRALEILKELIEGNTVSLQDLFTYEQKLIHEASLKIRPLVLKKEALRKVLKAYQNREVLTDTVQKWGMFMRWGIVGEWILKQKVPQSYEMLFYDPVDIQFDPLDEDKIIDILARLDELGDEVEGEISAQELEEMIQSLQD